MGQMGNQLDRWHASSGPRDAHLLRYWLELLVVLVVVVAQRRLDSNSSAATSTTERALPSSAVQLRC